MQNYRVEVQNHSEAMEAQDLFLKMGFRKELFSYSGYPKLVITDIDSIGGYSSGAEIGYLYADKITLPELRAMVSVQKYEELAKKYDGVKTKQLPNGIQFKKSKTSVTIYPSTGTIVSDVCGKINVLKNAGIGKLDHEMNKHFSVITPKQKEYLVKTDTGYTLQVLSDVVDGHDGIIEVPEVAVALVTYDKNAGYWFNKENKFKGFGRVSCIGDFGKIDTLDNDSYLDYSNAIDGCVAWERKESLNDQVASAEEYRQSFAKQNGIPIFLERQKFTQPEELPFVGGDTKFATEYPAEFFRKDDELDGDLCVEYVDNAWNKQIGGDHYKKLTIQPMEYALQNKLDYAQANVVKYVTRHADKNGKQDLLKAIHNIELMIAHYYSDQE